MAFLDEAFGGRAADGADRGDLPDEGEFTAAAVTGEGFEFGKFGEGFAELAELETDEQSGLSRRVTQESVVTNAGEALGENVEQPAANKLVRC